jgi:hypothetical protein
MIATESALGLRLFGIREGKACSGSCMPYFSYDKTVLAGIKNVFWFKANKVCFPAAQTLVL